MIKKSFKEGRSVRRSAWEGRNKFIVASIYTKKYHKGLESPTRNPEGGGESAFENLGGGGTF